MPISIDLAKQIQTITSDLGDIIRECKPVSPKEWAAFEGLVNAHKDLSKIDAGEFMQLPMNLDGKSNKEAKPRKDCPRCHGSGQWTDPISPKDPPRSCNCKDVEKAAWPNVKADWKALLK